MKLKLYQVDAFTEKLFGGNPAAVCPLDRWLDDELLQNIAAENNLSETAFFVKTDKGYQLRWFTPTVEVDLCGHATLAAAYILFNVLKIEETSIAFNSLSGQLFVAKSGELITLDFPSGNSVKIETTAKHLNCINTSPLEVYQAKKMMFILRDESEVRNAVPNFEEIIKLETDGLIITAKGNDVDFVSRYFAPHAGIPEDPVTGSAHTILTPHWSNKLNKKKLIALQVSGRGGSLICEDCNDRVKISGNAVLYSEGEIYL